MVKKFSALAVAAMLALPGVAAAGSSADDLARKVEQLTRQLEQLKAQMAEMRDDNEEQMERINESAEKWDLASRFQLSGDFRARADYVSAEVPSHFTALDVGAGVADVLDAGSSTNMNALLGAFGMNSNTPLTTFATALQGTPQANFVAAATGAGLSQKQADDLAAIFYNASVGAVLGGMPAGTTVGDILPSFSNAQNLVAFMKNIPAADRKAIFGNLTGAYAPTNPADNDNDTIYTNRLRLNMRVKATENIEFKGRLAMYKAWGMQSNPVDYTYNAGNGGGPFMLSSMSGMDGATTRQPADNILRVDRAIVNWNNVGGQPVWFSIGRRPTSDGPPAHLRMGLDKRMATPLAYMDYPFDGLTLGYAYRSFFGIEDFPGRIRFCYGRGFESGPTENGDGLNDVDFAGIAWDIYHKGDRFFYFQSYGAFNMFNVPDGVTFANPLEYNVWKLNKALYNVDTYDPLDPDNNLILDRANLGDIYHTSALYMDKYNDLNYFLVLGWSRTNPRGVDELGTGLLSSWWDTDYMDEKDGYGVYAGIRYDMPDQPLKLGLEYNYGSEYWISFTPGHDDLYASKLATRGSVAEGYLIWDIPGGEAISKYGKAFMRLGYQHYWYDYTGSGFWLGAPVDIDELANDPLNAQFYSPVDEMDQVYLTFEAYF